MISRRTVITGSLAGMALAAMTPEQAWANTVSKTSTVPSNMDDWVKVLSAHRHQVSFDIMGAGFHASHRACERQQSASAIKVFHLAGYAAAVECGHLKPNQRINVRDWERWYYPADGGAHAKALKRLKIPAIGNGLVAIAANSKATVRLDDIVSTMIQESDNASADFIRHLIGCRALDAVLHDNHARHTRIPTLLGANIKATHQNFVNVPAEQLANKYVSNRAFAEGLLKLKMADYAYQERYLGSGHGVQTSARDLTQIYHRVGSGHIRGAATMRRHLEWQPAASNGVKTGFKAGSLPGVLAIGMEQRNPKNGKHISGALLIGGLDQATAGSPNMDWEGIVLRAMNDPAYARRITTILS